MGIILVRDDLLNVWVVCANLSRCIIINTHQKRVREREKNYYLFLYERISYQFQDKCYLATILMDSYMACGGVEGVRKQAREKWQRVRSKNTNIMYVFNKETVSFCSLYIWLLCSSTWLRCVRLISTSFFFGEFHYNFFLFREYFADVLSDGGRAPSAWSKIITHIVLYNVYSQ